VKVLAVQPTHGDAHFLLGMIALSAGNVAKARQLIGRAIELAPASAEYHAQHARCHAALNRGPEALEQVDKALALGGADALTLDTIGVVLSKLGDHARAAAVFERAVAAQPQPSFYYNLGASLKFAGRFDEAERAYEAALSLDPDLARAHSALAALRSQTTGRNHIERLEQSLGTVGDDVDAELHLRHALAKELEDVGEYAAAFEQLSLGQAKKRRTLRYSIDDDCRLFEAVQSVFDRNFFASRPAGFPGADPIFVVGMPRTGTTLVERILSSHSGVVSVGESQTFPLEVKRASGTGSARVLDPETVQVAASADFTALGEAYVARTQPPHAERFVDKMPLNFLYVGFIAAALPNARIICLRRNALDTCLSNFRQLFAVNFSYYNYAYDLTDIGSYYVLFDRLMAHWTSRVPETVLEVRYEDLVREQEALTRRVLEFCRLPFESACLEFHRNTAPVATASAVQVRRPIFSDAVGRWKHYALQLEPLRAQLEAAGVDADA
jgi:tetratricopeptide (TPR) repeat protein